jgi:hypothetical protein
MIPPSSHWGKRRGGSTREEIQRITGKPIYSMQCYCVRPNGLLAGFPWVYRALWATTPVRAVCRGHRPGRRSSNREEAGTRQRFLAPGQVAEPGRTFGCVRLVSRRARAVRAEAWCRCCERVSHAQTSAMLTVWQLTEDLGFVNEVSSRPGFLKHVPPSLSSLLPTRGPQLSRTSPLAR